jgi:murein DD-endopeptidase MepM/ murein hydrolase activator NlpD
MFGMPSRRYTLIVADRTSGVVRRVTVSVRPTAIAGCTLLALPILIGMGAAWKAKSEVAALQISHQNLELENANYRAATESLAEQTSALQSAITEIGARSALDPNLARSMERLPAVIKSRAMGGNPEVAKTARKTLSSMMTPEDTFGLLRTLLEGIESGLETVRQSVERRNALANATPSLWPATGWLTSRMGPRLDPVTGGADYHAGLDIAGERGQPVYATAAGTVTHVGAQGAYGKLIVIDHGFGLETRYGHLSAFTVKPGDHVKRGDIIGKVGATGRATGYHLHYEVLANGKLLNPLQLLTQRPRDQ